MVQGVLPTQLVNTSPSRATGGHTPSRATGGSSGLTSNRGTVPGSLIDVLSILPGLRNNSSALLNTVTSLSSMGKTFGNVKDVTSSLKDGSSASDLAFRGSPPVVTSPVSASEPETFDYLDAPWASAYKMSRETAYSEALHNTSYQRAVKDMQRAGLNPAVIFGAGNGSTAGVPAYVSSDSYVRGRSGSGSPGSGHSSSSRKSSEKLFSSSAYSVMSALGGIVGSLATHSAGGYWIGTSLTQGAMNALSLLNKASKKR